MIREISSVPPSDSYSAGLFATPKGNFVDVLIGARDERHELVLAGKAGMPPLHPIYTRPAVRLDPDVHPIMRAVGDAFDGLGEGVADALQSPWLRIGAPIAVAIIFVAGILWMTLAQAWSGLFHHA